MTNKEKEDVSLVNIRRLFRKVLEDETIQYDKVCPLCGDKGMIAKWDWTTRSYASCRCKIPECKYGNA